ncbi:ATP F0F1 synthase subunit B [Pseudoroseicyclus tamaricis]|uniref:ATP synthase subunit b n=1 Tax=Pseudoroseicyclus tamaricis TaxID=2705421 RepID=A0A6B2JF87_9RHOB|nr:ATP F0F1 synthase subunit B [Pseudoroseicyclus tamaricis]NDU99670.1 ATP F0F1 synthase subunit B [Pseudoroseicyclus tamaricis]
MRRLLNAAITAPAVLAATLVSAAPLWAQEIDEAIEIEGGEAHVAEADGAHDTFLSLYNTDFIVLLAFILFIGILLYFRVPRMITRLLDNRSDTIKSELEEARALREEAQALLASYERKHKEVEAQAERIVSNARSEAQAAADASKAEIERSVSRKLASAQEQIEAARAAAIREVRDSAVTIAVAAARDVIAEHVGQSQGSQLIDESISTVEQKLH